MKRLFACLSLALLVGLTYTTSATAFDSPEDSQVVASFLDHLESVEADEALKTEAKKLIDELGAESSADAITEGLIKVYPEFATAIDAADSDDVDQAVKLLSPLTESNDKYLAADASFFLARALMNSERYEEALPKLEALRGDLKEYSTHSGLADYFMGLAQAGLLNNEAAITSFVSFLQNSPDAPERMRVSAWRQAQRLQGIKDGELTDVHQLMDYSRRRLEIIETDENTQERQDEIVKKLNVLIKKEEKKECSGSCKNCKKSGDKPKPSEQAKKQGKPSNKPSKSKQAGKSNVANGEAIVKSYDDSPASPWSRLRERSRDPANNAIKEKLPPKYRDLVERYSEKANGNDGEAENN